MTSGGGYISPKVNAHEQYWDINLENDLERVRCVEDLKKKLIEYGFPVCLFDIMNPYRDSFIPSVEHTFVSKFERLVLTIDETVPHWVNLFKSSKYPGIYGIFWPKNTQIRYPRFQSLMKDLPDFSNLDITSMMSTIQNPEQFVKLLADCDEHLFSKIEKIVLIEEQIKTVEPYSDEEWGLICEIYEIILNGPFAQLLKDSLTMYEIYQMLTKTKTIFKHFVNYFY